MNTQIDHQLSNSIKDFNLPEFREIPNVGLYLEQVTKYIGECLAPLDCAPLTGSMISNYVKKKIIKNPVKKQYGREQIACLIFIAIVKAVLPLEDVQLLLHIQEEAWETERAYESFRREFSHLLHQIFCSGGSIEHLPATDLPEKQLLLEIIVTAAHKIYLDHYIRLLRVSQNIPGES